VALSTSAAADGEMLAGSLLDPPLYAMITVEGTPSVAGFSAGFTCTNPTQKGTKSQLRTATANTTRICNGDFCMLLVHTP
jgi:hypothetical protein